MQENDIHHGDFIEFNRFLLRNFTKLPLVATVSAAQQNIKSHTELISIAIK